MPPKKISPSTLNAPEAPAGLTNLVDSYVDTPEGVQPERIHILLNRKVTEYADQYRQALYVSRGIPFNIEATSVTDILALLIANQQKVSGDEAVRRAAHYYRSWARDAEQDAWILAMLYDNQFPNEAKPYDPPEPPAPGIFAVPEPARNLEDPVERRYKQIIDLLSIDLDFQRRMMTAINDAFAKAVQLVDADESGFHAGAASDEVSTGNVAGSNGA